MYEGPDAGQLYISLRVLVHWVLPQWIRHAIKQLWQRSSQEIGWTLEVCGDMSRLNASLEAT